MGKGLPERHIKKTDNGIISSNKFIPFCKSKIDTYSLAGSVSIFFMIYYQLTSDYKCVNK